MKIIGYKGCSTCTNLLKELDNKSIKYEFIDYTDLPPTREQLVDWHEKSELDIKKFFNTSGKKYKELNLKDKLKEMDLEEKYDLLASDPMLVKRPIILDENQVYVGPLAKKYVEKI